MTTTNENVASAFAASLKDVVAAVCNLVEAGANEEINDWQEATTEIQQAAAEVMGNVESVQTAEAAGFGTALPNAFVVRLADGTSLMVEVTRVA